RLGIGARDRLVTGAATARVGRAEDQREHEQHGTRIHGELLTHGMPRTCMRNAKLSALRSTCWRTRSAPACPALRSMRSSIGALPALAHCIAATNLRACMGSTRASLSALSMSSAG